MRRRGILSIAVVTGALFCGFSFAQQPVDFIDGALNVLWGDSPAGQSFTRHRITLTERSGVTHQLAASKELLAGAIAKWNGRQVRVYPGVTTDEKTQSELVQVRVIELLDDSKTTAKAVTGSRPWISLLCKFADVADEPNDLAYFQNMYGDAPGQLNHYFKENSLGASDVAGSVAVDWVNLPGSHTDYVPTPGSGTNADLGAIFEDCTAAVDSMVDFANGGSPFDGINIMLNESLDCCAWGGGRYATLDGVAKVWRTTWNPPWAASNAAIIGHEMGHGLGLPHANNSDGDSNPYDNPWSTMSGATANTVSDATYGQRPKHFCAYHKDQLGWIPPAQRFEAAADAVYTIELDHVALAGTQNYLAAILPIDAERWYTVEARKQTGLYETNLPGEAVIIYSVDTTRPQPAWSVDMDVPPANVANNEGSMWKVNETFVVPEHRISISVDYVTDDGFGVTIDRTRATPVISAPDGQQSGPFQIDIDFGEDVLDFEVADISVTNGAASDLADVGEGAFTALITPTAEGILSASVPDGAATDAWAVPTATSEMLQVTVDLSSPAPVIDVPVGPQNGPFAVTVRFGEPVSVFTSSLLQVTNGEIADFANVGNGTYSATVTALADGKVTLNVAGNVVADSAGNPNLAASEAQVDVDRAGPAASLSAPQQFSGTFQASVNFGEPVTGFALGDVALTSASASNLIDQGDGRFTLDVTPAPREITVGIALASGVVQDAAGNGNHGAVPIQVSVAPGTFGQFDLEVDKFNDAVRVRDGDVVRYVIAVFNDGPDDAEDVSVTDLLPATLNNAEWTCLADGGASCASSGVGDIADLAHIPAGATVIYEVAAEVVHDPAGFVVNTATASPAPGFLELESSDNTSTDIDVLILFADSFETGPGQQ